MSKTNSLILPNAKILTIINQFGYGGAENLVNEYIPIMTNMGVENSLLVLRANKIKFNSNIKVLELGNQSIYNPILIFKLIKFFRSYDIIHVHLFPSLYWVALAKLFSFSSIKLVFTEHSTENKRRSSFLFSILDKLIYSLYDRIICITDETKYNLQLHIGREDRLFTINNGVNLGRFRNIHNLDRSVFNFDNDDFILIQVASFRDAKDQDTTIRSLTMLPEKVKLILVGDGERRRICENQVLQLGLVDRVLFLGNRNDIPSLLKMSDLVIVSSNYEGFGLVAIEGMAAHKPVIASNVDGLAQIVKDAGLLFEPKSHSQLAELIVKLITDRILYENVSDSCLNRAENYDIRVMVEKYLKQYKHLFGGEPM